MAVTGGVRSSKPVFLNAMLASAGTASHTGGIHPKLSTSPVRPPRPRLFFGRNTSTPTNTSPMAYYPLLFFPRAFALTLPQCEPPGTAEARYTHNHNKKTVLLFCECLRHGWKKIGTDYTPPSGIDCPATTPRHWNLECGITRYCRRRTAPVAPVFYAPVHVVSGSAGSRSRESSQVRTR